MRSGTKSSKDNALPTSPFGLGDSCITVQLLPLRNATLIPGVDCQVLRVNGTLPKFLSQSLCSLGIQPPIINDNDNNVSKYLGLTMYLSLFRMIHIH